MINIPLEFRGEVEEGVMLVVEEGLMLVVEEGLMLVVEEGLMLVEIALIILDSQSAHPLQFTKVLIYIQRERERERERYRM